MMEGKKQGVSLPPGIDSKLALTVAYTELCIPIINRIAGAQKVANIRGYIPIEISTDKHIVTSSRVLTAMAFFMALEHALEINVIRQVSEEMFPNGFSPDKGAALRSIGLTPGQTDEEVIRYFQQNEDAITRKIDLAINQLAPQLIERAENAAEKQNVFVDFEDLADAVDGLIQHQKAAVVEFIKADQLSVVSATRKTEIELLPSKASPLTPQSNNELESLKSEVAQWKSRHESVSNEVQNLRQRLEARIQASNDDDARSVQTAERNRGLQARVRYLQHHLTEARKASKTASVDPIPSSWDKLEQFADERLAGKVVLSKKAIRAARSSLFENIEFVYEVLLLLADDYVEMRQGDSQARDRFDAGCKRLRVSVEHTGEGVSSHVFKDTYSVKHNGMSLPLDLHVVGSSSRDPRVGFRLYFNYYDKTPGDEYIVVGHMPGHLENRMS